MACPAVDSERDVQPPSRDQLLQVDLPRVAAAAQFQTRVVLRALAVADIQRNTLNHIEDHWQTKDL